MSFLKKVAASFNNSVARDDYIHFLRGTLIPDLKESGTVETAKDFEAMIKFLNGATKANGMTKEHFINFISKTLIPDLRDSGTNETADTFEEGLSFLRRD